MGKKQRLEEETGKYREVTGEERGHRRLGRDNREKTED